MPDSRILTYAESIREAMAQAMTRDSRVFLLGEDVGVYGGAFGVSLGLVDQFGDQRVLDTPISEAGIVGASIGAALTGMRPIVEIQFSDFVGLAMDQLVNQAAKIHYMFGGFAHVPMVLRTPAGSGTGAAAQHSQSLEAWYCHVPGLKVVAPSTAYDAKGLLLSSIDDDNPVVFIEQKLLYRTQGEVPEEDYRIPLSQTEIKREGSDISIVSWGRMLSFCQSAADKLAKKGISCEILDPRTLMPLDDAPIIESVCKTGKVIIVHEAVKTGGYGGEIAARIADSEAFFHLDAPIRRLGGLEVPVPYAPELERAVVPGEEQIIQTVESMLS